MAKASDRLAIAGFIALTALRVVLSFGLIFLAACDPTSTPAPSTAPRPDTYTCAQQRKAASEVELMPADGVMRSTVLPNYTRLQRRLRAIHQLPEPDACAGVPAT